MNPLLSNLFRSYRTTGTPRLERQATDLVALMRAEHAEAEAAAIRAATGYVRAKREAAASASIWGRKRPPLVVWEKYLPSVLRRQAE